MHAHHFKGMTRGSSHTPGKGTEVRRRYAAPPTAESTASPVMNSPVKLGPPIRMYAPYRGLSSREAGCTSAGAPRLA